MHTRSIATFATIMLGVLFIGCASAPPRPALISHVVFVELHDPADIPELIADSDATLAHIPGVVSYATGQPIDTGRDTVLDDYDVGMSLGFDSAEAYARYVAHPDHTRFVARWKPRLTALRIYNFEDVTP